MKIPRVPVAREGYPFIAFAALATVVMALLDLMIPALCGLVLTAFVLNFFRDPERVPCEDEDALMSPADGKVIIVEKVIDDRYLGEEVHKVSIFMDVFSVHVNRAPVSGRVEKVVYQPGRFYSANTKRSSLENESCAMILATTGGRRMAVVQIAGVIARRIICWAGRGDGLAKGERYGMIRFGSRVDLFLPLTTRLEVARGQQVRAGETVIGRLQ